MSEAGKECARRAEITPGAVPTAVSVGARGPLTRDEVRYLRLSATNELLLCMAHPDDGGG
ncbi:MAG: hypothetical protein CMM26_09660 [Rhodospirillaceae bacterium]|nr:hypothetical protein [Rhodospirillaceae bacterium]|tara:strand:+ start:1049 stop:1228 length:180 start_codon:yes stop_codon:yes gene_type:complete